MTPIIFTKTRMTFVILRCFKKNATYLQLKICNKIIFTKHKIRFVFIYYFFFAYLQLKIRIKIILLAHFKELF